MVDLSNIVRLPSAWFGDSMRNFLAGFGMPGRDKAQSQFWFLNELTTDQLEAAYRGDWVARKIIEIPADDCTRAWRQWQADKDQIAALEETEKQFGLQRKVRSALIKSRLYGGAAIILGVDQGTFQDELDLEAVGEGDLKFVHVVQRWMIAAGPPVREITSPWFGEPTYYQRSSTVTTDPPDPRIENVGLPTMGVQPGEQLFIHPSRVIRLVGCDYPDMEHAKDVWGDSVLQPVQDALKAAGMVSPSIATMISEAKLDIFKVPNLTAKMATQEGTTELFNRFSQGNVAKSTINALLVDMAEEFERIHLNMANYDKILSMYFMLCCAAADIPVTRFMGREPAGQNATGEGDLNNYHDRLASDQKVRITPALSRLDEVLIRHTFGSRDPAIHYNWAPLKQMTEPEKAALNLQVAQAHKIDVDAGIISPHVLQQGRQNFLIESGFMYPGIANAIDEEADWDAEEGMQQARTGGMQDPNDPGIIEHKAGIAAKFALPDEPGGGPQRDANSFREPAGSPTGGRYAKGQAAKSSSYQPARLFNHNASVGYVQEMARYYSSAPAKLKDMVSTAEVHFYPNYKSFTTETNHPNAPQGVTAVTNFDKVHNTMMFGFCETCMDGVNSTARQKTVIHEMFHAADARNDITKSASYLKAFAADVNKDTVDAIVADGYEHWADPKEAFAEAAAILVVMGDKPAFSKHFPNVMEWTDRSLTGNGINISQAPISSAPFISGGAPIGIGGFGAVGSGP